MDNLQPLLLAASPGAWVYLKTSRWDLNPVFDIADGIYAKIIYILWDCWHLWQPTRWTREVVNLEFQALKTQTHTSDMFDRAERILRYLSWRRSIATRYLPYGQSYDAAILSECDIEVESLDSLCSEAEPLLTIVPKNHSDVKKIGAYYADFQKKLEALKTLSIKPYENYAQAWSESVNSLKNFASLLLKKQKPLARDLERGLYYGTGHWMIRCGQCASHSGPIDVLKIKLDPGCDWFLKELKESDSLVTLCMKELTDFVKQQDVVQRRPLSISLVVPEYCNENVASRIHDKLSVPILEFLQKTHLLGRRTVYQRLWDSGQEKIALFCLNHLIIRLREEQSTIEQRFKGVDVVPRGEHFIFSLIPRGTLVQNLLNDSKTYDCHMLVSQGERVGFMKRVFLEAFPYFTAQEQFSRETLKLIDLQKCLPPEFKWESTPNKTWIVTWLVEYAYLREHPCVPSNPSQATTDALELYFKCWNFFCASYPNFDGL